MEICDISLSEDTDEDMVQFVKHIQENLDPNDEHNCKVWVETVNANNYEDTPWSESGPKLGIAHDTDTFGPVVRIVGEFEENKDAVGIEVGNLADQFFGSNEYVFYSSFPGGSNEEEIFVVQKK
jgi:hypothetical protein